MFSLLFLAYYSRLFCHHIAFVVLGLLYDEAKYDTTLTPAPKNITATIVTTMKEVLPTVTGSTSGANRTKVP